MLGILDAAQLVYTWACHSLPMLPSRPRCIFAHEPPDADSSKMTAALRYNSAPIFSARSARNLHPGVDAGRGRTGGSNLLYLRPGGHRRRGPSGRGGPLRQPRHSLHRGLCPGGHSRRRRGRPPLPAGLPGHRLRRPQQLLRLLLLRRPRRGGLRRQRRRLLQQAPGKRGTCTTVRLRDSCACNTDPRLHRDSWRFYTVSS